MTGPHSFSELAVGEPGQESPAPPPTGQLSVATVNVNGIRAAVKHRSERNRGFHEWLAHAAVDVVLLQEVRASESQAREALAPALDAGWHLAVAPAAARGRAGVGILSRAPLSAVEVGIPGFEDSGRWIEATISTADVADARSSLSTAGQASPAPDAHADLGDIRLASLYLPSGGVGAKQDEKYAFLDALSPVMAAKADEYEYMLVAGDWNICHRREDLKNWKTNRKKAGFLPDERAFMDSVFGPGPLAVASQINDLTEAPRGAVRDNGLRVGNAGAIGDFFGSADYVPTPASVRSPAATPQWIDVQRSLHPEDEGPYSWYTWRGQAFDTGAGWRIDVHAATLPLAARALSARTDKAPEYDLRWSDHSPVVATFG